MKKVKLSNIIINGQISQEGLKELENISEYVENLLNSFAIVYNLPVLNYNTDGLFPKLCFFTKEEVDESVIDYYKSALNRVKLMTVREFKKWKKMMY